MVIFHNVVQGSPEWHKLREELYTGSGADKLLTAGKKVTIQNGKVLQYAANSSSEWGGNYDTRRGHALEDRAVSLYQRVHDLILDRPGFITNDRFPGCGYSPDAWRVEVKAFKKEKHEAIKTKADIPFKVLAQVHFGMAISEWAFIDLVFYNPECDDPLEALKIFRIRKDKNIIANFRRILA